MESIITTIVFCLLSFWIGWCAHRAIGRVPIGTIFVDDSEGETHIWLECPSMDAIKNSGSGAVFKVVKLDGPRK